MVPWKALELWWQQKILLSLCLCLSDMSNQLCYHMWTSLLMRMNNSEAMKNLVVWLCSQQIWDLERCLFLVQVWYRGEIKNTYVHISCRNFSYIQAHSAFTGWLYGKIKAFHCLGKLQQLSRIIELRRSKFEVKWTWRLHTVLGFYIKQAQGWMQHSSCKMDVERVKKPAITSVTIHSG